MATENKEENSDSKNQFGYDKSASVSMTNNLSEYNLNKNSKNLNKNLRQN